MKRHISLLVCLLALAAIALVACVGPGHQHTYSDKWSYDETNHWHAATCSEAVECAAEKGSLNAHADADNDSVCDVCGYDYDHTHTYADEWTADADGHRHAATCNCTVAAKDDAAHTDADNDGACDVCAYDGGHEHEFIEDAWAMDAANHWHAAKCGHDVTMEEPEAHDMNDAGSCDVCGYTGDMTVAKAVGLGEYFQTLVNGGKVVYTEDTYAPVVTTIDFVFGNKFAEYNSVLVSPYYTAKTNSYYAMMANGSLFAVEEYLTEDGEVESVSLPYAPDSSMVNGYNFNSIFYYDEEASFYGAADLVTGLYDLAKAQTDSFKEYLIQYNGENVYIFTFDSEVFGEYSFYQYKVQVTFTLGDGYNFENVTVSSERYTVTATTEGEGDAAVTTYAMDNLFPIAVFEYNVEQTVGALATQMTYDPAKVLMTDFKLTDEAGADLGTTITVEAGKPLSWFVTPVTPADAVVKLNSIEVEAEGIWANVWDETGNIYFSAPKPGTYTLKIKTPLAEKTVTLVTTQPATTNLYPYVMDEGIQISTDEFEVYVNEGTATVVFGATANAHADAGFNYNCADTNATITPVGDGTFTFVAPIGVYEIVMTSTKDNTVTATLTISVEEEPVIDLTLSGTYNVNFIMEGLYVLTFDNGVLTVEDNNNYTLTGTYNYSVDADNIVTIDNDGAFTVSLAMGGQGWQFMCPAFRIPQNLVPATPSVGGSVEDILYDHGWECYGDDPGMPDYSIAFNGADGYVSDNVNSIYPDFTYVVEGNDIYITFEGDYDGVFANATWFYDDVDGVVVAMIDPYTPIVFDAISY